MNLGQVFENIWKHLGYILNLFRNLAYQKPPNFPAWYWLKLKGIINQENFLNVNGWTSHIKIKSSWYITKRFNKQQISIRNLIFFFRRRLKWWLAIAQFPVQYNQYFSSFLYFGDLAAKCNIRGKCGLHCMK